jgi:hypothetical protein
MLSLVLSLALLLVLLVLLVLEEYYLTDFSNFLSVLVYPFHFLFYILFLSAVHLGICFFLLLV